MKKSVIPLKTHFILEIEDVFRYTSWIRFHFRHFVWYLDYFKKHIFNCVSHNWESKQKMSAKVAYRFFYDVVFQQLFFFTQKVISIYDFIWSQTIIKKYQKMYSDELVFLNTSSISKMKCILRGITGAE